MFSFIQKTLRVCRERPAKIGQSLRGYTLFAVSSRIAHLIYQGNLSRVQLGINVRLQRLKVLSAEANARIAIGDHSIIYENAMIEAYGNGKIILGERAVVGDVRIIARESITIGKRALFSWNVFIQDFVPHPVNPEKRAEQMNYITDQFMPRFKNLREQHAVPRFSWNAPSAPIEIGDDVWFGANTTILPGVKIGSGSVIAAGAVVTRGVYMPRSLLAGNPAKVVRMIE